MVVQASNKHFGQGQRVYDVAAQPIEIGEEGRVGAQENHNIDYKLLLKFLIAENGLD